VATKRKPSKKQNAAARLKARSQRAAKVWNLFMEGVPMSTIATVVGCAPQTVKNDITDTEQALKELDALRASDTRDRAIEDRRHLKKLALDDRTEAEVKDRAPLLKEARHNQTGIEVLQDLHPKEAPLIQAGAMLIQVGEGPSQPLAELTDEELEAADAHLGSELAALPPAPDDAEEPATEA